MKIYQLYKSGNQIWLCVDIQEIHDLGIQTDISSLSHQKSNSAYLNTVDSNIFIKAKEMAGYKLGRSWKYSSDVKFEKIETFLKYIPICTNKLNWLKKIRNLRYDIETLSEKTVKTLK